MVWKTDPIVLSVPVKVPGHAPIQALLAPATTPRVDGYSLTLDGAPSNGGQLRVNFAKEDKPVTDLHP
jgi:hypothetical protein